MRTSNVSIELKYFKCYTQTIYYSRKHTGNWNILSGLGIEEFSILNGKSLQNIKISMPYIMITKLYSTVVYFIKIFSFFLDFSWCIFRIIWIAITVWRFYTGHHCVSVFFTLRSINFVRRCSFFNYALRQIGRKSTIRILRFLSDPRKNCVYIMGETCTFRTHILGSPLFRKGKLTRKKN